MPRKRLIFIPWIALLATCSEIQHTGPMLGHIATSAEIEAWNIGVFPDGSGLPPGQGTVSVGETLYNRRCANCHGSEGEGHTAEELVSYNRDLTGEFPDKTIGTYWPYATTLFDFVRRSMPLDAPGSLSDDDVYAITAYLLYLNDIVPKETVIDSRSLAKIKMPNRRGFIPIDVDLSK